MLNIQFHTFLITKLEKIISNSLFIGFFKKYNPESSDAPSKIFSKFIIKRFEANLFYWSGFKRTKLKRQKEVLSSFLV